MYLLIVPLLMEINITKTLGNAVKSVVINISNSLAFIGLPNLCVTGAALVAAAIVINYFFQVVLVISGALVVKDSIAWISDLIGSEDLQKNGADLNGKVMKSGLKVASVAMPALRGGAALGKLAGKGLGAVGGAAVGGASKVFSGIKGAASGYGFKAGAAKSSFSGHVKRGIKAGGFLAGGSLDTAAKGINFLKDKKVGFISKHKDLNNFISGVSGALDPNKSFSQLRGFAGLADPSVDDANARNTARSDLKAFNKAKKDNAETEKTHGEHLDDARSRKSVAYGRFKTDKSSLDKAKAHRNANINKKMDHFRTLMSGGYSDGSSDDSEVMKFLNGKGADMSEVERLKELSHIATKSVDSANPSESAHAIKKLRRKVNHDLGDIDLAKRDIIGQENVAEKDRQDDTIRESLQSSGIKTEDINKLVQAIRNGLSKDDLGKDDTYKKILSAFEQAGKDSAKLSVGDDAAGVSPKTIKADSVKVEAGTAEEKSGSTKATIDAGSAAAIGKEVAKAVSSGIKEATPEIVRQVGESIKKGTAEGVKEGMKGSKK
jgi:hypothetical protein